MENTTLRTITKKMQSLFMAFLMVMSIVPLVALEVDAGTISVDASLQKEQSKTVQLGIKNYALKLNKVIDTQTAMLQVEGETITATLGEHVLLKDGSELVVTEISQQGTTDIVELSLSAEDVHAPVLQGITTDADSVKAGQTITVILTVEDDFTGVSYLAIDAKSPSGGQTLYAGGGVQHNPETTYSFPVAVPTNAEDGFWKISQVLVIDAVANQEYLYNPDDFTKTFRVVSEQSDVQEPELVSIAVTESVFYGETVTLTVVARDDLSGVKTLRATAKSPTGKQNELFTPWQLISENTWQSSIVIKDYAEQGYWKITQLEIEDNAHNKAVLYYGNQYEAGFNVKSNNNKDDTKAPVFSEIKLSPEQLRYGNTVTLRVKLTDDLSGIDESSLFAMLESFAQGQYQYSQQWSYDSQTSTYTTSFSVPKFSEIGPWHLGRLVVRDKAGNELYQWFDKDDYWVYVTGYDDIKKPDLVVKSLELSPTQAKNNENVTMKVVVRNDYAPVARVSWKAIADDIGSNARIGAGWARGNQDGVLENLAVGEERTLTLSFQYNTGTSSPSTTMTYTPSFTIDPENSINELDEHNNKLSGYVRVSGGSSMADAVVAPRTTTDPRDYFDDYYGIEDFYITSEPWVGNVHWNDPNRAYTEKIGNKVIAHLEDASPSLLLDQEDLRFTAYTSGNKIFVEKWVDQGVKYTDKTHLILAYPTPKKVVLEDTGQTYTGTRIDLVLWNDVHDSDATRTMTIQDTPTETASAVTDSVDSGAGGRSSVATSAEAATAVIIPSSTAMPKTIDVMLGDEFVLSAGQTAHVVDYRDMEITLNSISSMSGEDICFSMMGCPGLLYFFAHMDVTARLADNYFSLPFITLTEGKQRGVFGAQLSVLSLNADKGLFKLTKGNDQTVSWVDVGLEPRSVEVTAGEKAYYEIIVEDDRFFGYYGRMEQNYTLDIVGLPFAKDFPSTITLGPGETKRVPLVVDTSSRLNLQKQIVGGTTASSTTVATDRDTVPKTVSLSLRQGTTRTIEMDGELLQLVLETVSATEASFSVNGESSLQLEQGEVWTFGSGFNLTVDSINYHGNFANSAVVTITSPTGVVFVLKGCTDSNIYNKDYCSGLSEGQEVRCDCNTCSCVMGSDGNLYPGSCTEMACNSYSSSSVKEETSGTTTDHLNDVDEEVVVETGTSSGGSGGAGPMVESRSNGGGSDVGTFTQKEGTSKTVTVNGVEYAITVDAVASGPKAYFTVNGESIGDLEEGETYLLKEGSELGVTNMIYYGYASEIGNQVTYTIQTKKVKLTDSVTSVSSYGSSTAPSGGGGAGGGEVPPKEEKGGVGAAWPYIGESAGGGGGAAGPRISDDSTQAEATVTSVTASVRRVQSSESSVVYETVALPATDVAVSATASSTTATESVALPESVVVRPVSAGTFFSPEQLTDKTVAEGEVYHFTVVVISTDGSENDVASGTLVIGNQSSVEKRHTKQIQLIDGWNLVSIPNRLITFDTSTCSEDKKPLAFVYNDEEQKYLSFRDAQKQLGSAFLKYISERALWMYSYTSCTLDVTLGKETLYSDLSLSEGWNLMPVTYDMIGQRFIDLGSNCQYHKLYRWNSEDQQWLSAEISTLITEADLMRGFLVKTTSYCEWGEYTLLPPPMPVEEERASGIRE
ncbi:hypothetical protein HYW21_04140 [Candidatus Woesearchaeota archaeon]|nr:hypothetical protein [Candidatus Woesearchaeota archaeon]